MVRNLPFTILPYVDEGISTLDLITGGSHGELVNSSILAPVVADVDVAAYIGLSNKQKQTQYHVFIIKNITRDVYKARQIT